MKGDERKRERYSMTGFILVCNAGGPVEFERKEKRDSSINKVSL